MTYMDSDLFMDGRLVEFVFRENQHFTSLPRLNSTIPRLSTMSDYCVCLRILSVHQLFFRDTSRTIISSISADYFLNQPMVYMYVFDDLIRCIVSP